MQTSTLVKRIAASAFIQGTSVQESTTHSPASELATRRLIKCKPHVNAIVVGQDCKVKIMLSPLPSAKNNESTRCSTTPLEDEQRT